jgi:signal transduction histidine kinase
MNDRKSSEKLTTILVADDEHTVREYLSALLRHNGHVVMEVENGSDALNALLSPSGPSLAVMDWDMPGMTGVDVCRAIRKTRDHGLLYIILITGAAQAEDVVEALESGADDFLKKPFRNGELLARIRAARRILELSHEKIAMIKQLEEQQRLESIGRLAAGIAHEINTPMQYIGDNTRFISDSLKDIFGVIEVVKNMAAKIEGGACCDDVVDAVHKAMADADIDYISEQIPEAVAQSMEGIERVTKIVRAMKELAHPGSGEATPSDINHMLETVVTVSRNEWKYVADLVTDLQSALPPVSCFIADLNQAVLNIIVNAAHSIAEKQVRTGDTAKGHITVTSLKVGGLVEIRISDSGEGIPKYIQHRIMEPFFTTKEVGRGTGQGLPIARSAIVDKHRGTLDFETEEGVGSTFIIRIPIEER